MTTLTGQTAPVVSQKAKTIFLLVDWRARKASVHTPHTHTLTHRMEGNAGCAPPAPGGALVNFK